MKKVTVSAASAEIKVDKSMVIGGGIHPWFAREQEGKIRASTVIVEKDYVKISITSCDVLALTRDILDDAARKIEVEFGIPLNNILIAATHTHHAPTTVSVHGYKREEEFCKRVKDAILASVERAEENLVKNGEDNMYFWLGIESTIGQNSRLLLSDGTIYWVGPRDDALRPTGPVDPELPVIAFKGKEGNLKALIFNHSTHNIGSRKPFSCSPGFYGLAAQELEGEVGGTVIFLPGAFGSTHNLTLSTDEMIHRLKSAIKEALSLARLMEVQDIISVKQEFDYRIRRFNEEEEDIAVSQYCMKRANNPEAIIEVFRKMRRDLSKFQGEKRRSWLQVMLLGDIALIGVPGELFTKLGLLIKRLSPFRYTYVVSLANDYIGYIPDNEAFKLGGYQTWTGFHSYVERGTGEYIVEKSIEILSSLRSSVRKQS